MLFCMLNVTGTVRLSLNQATADFVVDVNCCVRRVGEAFVDGLNTSKAQQ